MGFSNAKKRKNNNRIFLDREDILELIETNVRIYDERTDFFKLFTFYGMGGIGKSQLMKRIYSLYNGSKPNIYYYPLEILNHETIPSILLCIRRKFDYTPHFDYVLFRYWDFISCDRIDRKTLYSISGKIFSRMGRLFDATLGYGILDTEQLVGEIITLYEEKEIADEEKQYVSELLQDKIEDLYTYLAETLAKDIQKNLHNLKYMFLFDAYDLGKSKYKFDWLKVFINAFGTGIFFVTSRESLDWFDDNIDKCAIENRSLNTIPKAEVQKYLSGEAYTPEQINLIIKKTDCIPLYLDLAIAMDKATLFSKSKIIGFERKEDLVIHFLSHLDNAEQLIIEYLSVVNLFNEEIYNNAIRFNNLSLQKYPFTDFKKSTIVRYIEHFNGLYKIHNVLANNISFFVNAQLQTKIIDDYLNTVYARIIYDVDICDDIKYNLITNIYRLIENNNLHISECQAEKLIDLYFYLSDRSYGNDFYNYINSIQDKENNSRTLIYEYIRGKSTRVFNIVAGLEQLQSIPLSECNFGKHKKSLVCDINYLLSISGKYYEAEIRMNDFAKSLTEAEKNERYYIKGIIYCCDMKMLRGKFKSAVADLELMSNDVASEKLLYEIQKAIGHCYRFNFLYDIALKYYKRTTSSPYNMAYYLTVCCETYCYFDPQKVIDIFPKAIEENQRYNNHNNLGKIYYSVAIATLVSRNAYQAKKYIKKAYAEFKHTNYHAGIFFVMIAEAYIEYSERHTISTETIIKIRQKLMKIDSIYEYLLLPVYVMRESYDKIEELRWKFEWFSFELTLKNIKNFLALL